MAFPYLQADVWTATATANDWPLLMMGQQSKALREGKQGETEDAGKHMKLERKLSSSSSSDSSHTAMTAVSHVPHEILPKSASISSPRL